jgi:hypothetical protein
MAAVMTLIAVFIPEHATLLRLGGALTFALAVASAFFTYADTTRYRLSTRQAKTLKKALSQVEAEDRRAEIYHLAGNADSTRLADQLERALNGASWIVQRSAFQMPLRDFEGLGVQWRTHEQENSARSLTEALEDAGFEARECATPTVASGPLAILVGSKP